MHQLWERAEWLGDTSSVWGQLCRKSLPHVYKKTFKQKKFTRWRPSGHGQVMVRSWSGQSSVSHWVCEWQGHLMSCSGQLKNNRKTLLTPYESDWFTENYIFGLFCSTPPHNILTTLNSEYYGIIFFSLTFILSIVHIDILFFKSGLSICFFF